MKKKRKNMPNDQKELPIFENEDEERAFWATHDSTEYINWDEGEITLLPTLKPSTRAISLRLPEFMLNELRLIANKRDIPYQSLIKIFLKERIDQELKTFTENRDTFAAD
jgi:predicted DNA binding CopG/RHH family protein